MATPFPFPPQRAQLVFNPLSGNHSTARIDRLAAALSSVGFTVTLTPSSPQHPLIIDPGSTHICVAGGDGTVRHVAAAMADLKYPPSFSVYPMGTINLVAREWNAPRDPAAFARHVVQQGARRVLPIVKINDTHFVACASIGPDSLAVATVSGALKSRIGRIAYGVSLARVLIGWTPPKLKVQIGAMAYECGALYVANGRYYAGPWVVAPLARLNDQSLQVTMLVRARRRDFVLFVLAVLLGRTASLANVKTVEARSLSITTDSAVTVQLDGDNGTTLPANIAFTGQTLRG
jgi:diacylglycerol kinase (ATP)